jgi:hypothetical protein
MISLSLLPAGIPPSQIPSELDRLIVLIRFAMDPEAVAKRINELLEAARDSIDVTTSADKVRAEFANERALLAAEREKHTQELAAERSAHDAQCNQRDAAINDRDQESKQLHASAQAARDKAESTLAEVTARLDRIKAAAA